MIRLFTTWYDEKHEERRAEYLNCLERNLACNAISELHILHEGGNLPPDPTGKLRAHPCEQRPSYHDFFIRINDLAGPDDFSIIANTDIFFDEDIRVLALLDWDKKVCLAVSRWDWHGDGKAVLYERGDSQDCWIFRGPVTGVRADFPLGVLDCDNKIAWELEQAGYEVRNPALSLRTFHIHDCGYRSYRESTPPDFGIRPPFRYVEPEVFGSFFTCLRLYREARLSTFPWRLTRNKLARFAPVRLLLRAWNKLRRLK